MFKRAISRAARGGLVLLMIGLGVAMASTNESESPLGLWATPSGHGVIAIDPCGDALCGQIVGIDRAPTEPMPTDVHGQSQCGLTIITNERPDGSGTWLGNVTDPRDGSTYDAKIWLESGNLHLRGYIGIPLLGSTQVWHKFTGHLTADCGVT